MINVFLAHRKFGVSQRVQTNLNPPSKDTTHGLSIFFSRLLVRILFEYFIPQTAVSKLAFIFFLPLRWREQQGGKNLKMTKHTESKEPLNGLLGEHWRLTQRCPKPLPRCSVWPHYRAAPSCFAAGMSEVGESAMDQM